MWLFHDKGGDKGRLRYRREMPKFRWCLCETKYYDCRKVSRGGGGGVSIQTWGGMLTAVNDVYGGNRSKVKILSKSTTISILVKKDKFDAQAGTLVIVCLPPITHP